MSLPDLLRQPPNGFDNLVVDVADLHRRFPVDRPADLGWRWDSPPERLYRSGLLPLRARNAAWQILRRTRLDAAWFERFKRYWGRVLGGRPLWGVEDFYFLRNVYRMRFSAAGVADDATAAAHLESWQRPEVLSHLFHSVYKESLGNELRLLEPALALHSGPLRTVLEFGCGSAPITTTLFELMPAASGLRAFIADIETVPFHYAAHKLAHWPQVRAVPLRPETGFRFPLAEKCDAIFCMTVFEHLHEPLAIAEHLHSLLAPGGLLVFDYILSDADGLDTRAGLEQRPAVIEYFRKHFRVLRGTLDAERSMAATIVTPL
jgi:SAM-dependent methyltransferase